jgi:ABC-2 type transport system permease protein
VKLWRTMTWGEIKLFLREPLTVVFAFGFPLIMLLVLAEVFGTAPSDEPTASGVMPWRGAPPLSYYVPGYVALAAAAVGLIMIPAHLASYRERGVLRRFRAASIPASTVFGAQIAVQVVLSVLGGLLVVVAAYAVYDIAAPSDAFGAAVAFLFCIAAFAAIGVLLGAVMPSPRAAQGAGVLLFIVMLMLSGTGPPREVMTSTMNTIADILPLGHGVRAIQDPWLGFGWNFAQLGILTAIAIVCGVLATLAFRRQ